MSRNFELLQKIEKEREASQGLEVPAQYGLSVLTDPPAQSCSLETTSPEIEELPRKELDKLVGRLFLSPDATKAVVFSAADRGDGCSWVAARTAVQLAGQVSGSVCLLDANGISPALHCEFGVEKMSGVRNAFSQTSSVRSFAQQLSPANLWLITSESLRRDREEMAAAKSIVSQIAELRREFDYVVIDAPPLHLSSDAISLAHCTDGIIIVVSANSTRRATCRQIARDLESSNVRVLGAVLNKRTFPVPAVIHRKLQQYFGAMDF